MVLSTHAITGAAVASLNPARPFSGFVAGFVLHFILDAIPHWDYKIKSGSIDPYVGSAFIFDRYFFGDVLRIVSDLALGVSISLAVFYFYWPAPIWAVLAGVAGGILPDALQFAYGRLHWRSLSLLQDFHFWIHTTRKLKGRPVLGITLQTLLVILIIAAVFYSQNY
ncbi:MAG: hypothetical protein AAB527_01070 [Patescibacteria group bacterium]